jgi:hypothetical protein
MRNRLPSAYICVPMRLCIQNPRKCLDPRILSTPAGTRTPSMVRAPDFCLLPERNSGQPDQNPIFMTNKPDKVQTNPLHTHDHVHTRTHSHTPPHSQTHTRTWIFICSLLSLHEISNPQIQKANNSRTHSGEMQLSRIRLSWNPAPWNPAFMESGVHGIRLSWNPAHWNPAFLESGFLESGPLESGFPGIRLPGIRLWGNPAFPPRGSSRSVVLGRSTQKFWTRWRR